MVESNFASLSGLNSPVFAENWRSVYRKVGDVLLGQDGNENYEVSYGLQCLG